VATAHLGPDAPGELVSWITTTRVPAPSRREPAEVYDLAHAGHNGHFVTGWSESLSRDRFAVVHARHAGSDGVSYTKWSRPFLDDAVGLLSPFSAVGFTYRGSFERTELLFGPGFRWQSELDVGPFPPLPDLAVFTVPVLRPPGEIVERWNRAPSGPAFPPTGAENPLFELAGIIRPNPFREGDALWLRPALLSDAPDVVGDRPPQPRGSASIFATARTALFRDGALVKELFDQDAQFPDPFRVPPEPATYRLEAEIEPPPGALELSTRVTAAWTFRSQHAGGTAPELLPLPVVRFTPALDDHNVAARVHVLPAIVERPAGAPRPPIARVDVSASFDDGATWTAIPSITIGDRWLGVVVAPRQATHISLRASARDVQGRQVEQTIVRAYGIAASTAP
jgi:hypothetical protein